MSKKLKVVTGIFIGIVLVKALVKAYDAGYDDAALAYSELANLKHEFKFGMEAEKHEE